MNGQADNNSGSAVQYQTPPEEVKATEIPVQQYAYGEPQYEQDMYYDTGLAAYYEEEAKSAKNLGAVGLGLSIGGFVTGLAFIGLILDLVGITLGALSVKKNPGRKGLGISAIAIGSVGFLLTLLVYGFVINDMRNEFADESFWDDTYDIVEDYTYDDTYDTYTDTASEQGGSQVREKERYSVGDRFVVHTEYGDYAMKITGVSETSERNSYSDVKADRVIVVDYECENIDYAMEFDNYYNDKVYMSSATFDAYDADGMAMREYYLPGTSSTAVTPGHKATGQMAFALNNKKDRVELELNEYTTNGAGIVIDLKW